MSSSSRGRPRSQDGKHSRDEDLALFQDMRMRERNAFLGSSSETVDHAGEFCPFLLASCSSQAAARFERGRKGSNDLLTSEMDSSKNDYDWLLTPPGTPLFPSLDRDLLATASSPTSRKPSRLSSLDLHARSVGQSATLALDSSTSSASSSSASTRIAPLRNPSPSRHPAASSRSGIKQQQQQLQTSSSNVNTGLRRPSTPTRQSAAPRSATPTGRAAAARPSTPTRPSPSSARPSTPTSRSTISSSSSSIPGSRPATPTRRPMASTTTPTSAATSGVPSSRSSRGTSPMRGSSKQSPVASVGASFRTPETNHRPLSNTRSSTIASSPLLVKAELRRQTLDGAAGLLNRSYAHHSDREISSFSRRAVTSTNDGLSLSSYRSSMLQPQQQQDDKSVLSAKKSTRPAGTRETSFYGTSISKKSLDTAIRHMVSLLLIDLYLIRSLQQDIRRSSPGGFRAPLVASNSALRHPQAAPLIPSARHAERSGSGNQVYSSMNSSNGYGNASSNGKELEMFSAAAAGEPVDSFLLDSGGLEDFHEHL